MKIHVTIDRSTNKSLKSTDIFTECPQQRLAGRVFKTFREKKNQAWVRNSRSKNQDAMASQQRTKHLIKYLAESTLFKRIGSNRDGKRCTLHSNCVAMHWVGVAAQDPVRHMTLKRSLARFSRLHASTHAVMA